MGEKSTSVLCHLRLRICIEIWICDCLALQWLDQWNIMLCFKKNICHTQQPYQCPSFFKQLIRNTHPGFVKSFVCKVGNCVGRYAVAWGYPCSLDRDTGVYMEAVTQTLLGPDRWHISFVLPAPSRASRVHFPQGHCHFCPWCVLVSKEHLRFLQVESSGPQSAAAAAAATW